jgi:hypothetical protein
MKHLIDALMSHALEIADIYDRVVTFDLDSEDWNIRLPSEVLESEVSSPIANGHKDLRNCIALCVGLLIPEAE